MGKNSIWITGASGRVGKRLIKILQKNVDNKIVATDTDVDVTDLEAVRRAVDFYRPNIIINCASLSNAAYCEENMVEAFKVNALGARNIAIAAGQHNIKVIQMSTDDVFCGENNRSKTEFDMPTPSTVYGKSKFAGENYVRELCKKHLIIRSSWMYGTGGNDYLTFVLDKAEKGEKFEAALDVCSTPTSADQVAEFVAKMIGSHEYGIFHASDEGMCTRHQYATKILSECGYDPSLAVGTFNKVDGAIVSTVLENLMMKMTGVYEMPNWEADLENYIAKTIKGGK